MESSSAIGMTATSNNQIQRVLLVCTNLNNQGVETHAVHFARACRDQGVACTLAVHPNGFIARLARQHDIPVVPLKITAALDLGAVVALWKILRRGKFDVLLGSDAREFLPIVLAGRLSGVASFLFRHVNHPLKRAEAWVYTRLIAAFFPVSVFTQAVLVRLGIPLDKAPVLYNPIAILPAAQCLAWRAQIRARLALPDDALLVGFAGSLREYKGSFLLAEALNLAMATTPKLYALWIGPEVEHQALRQTITAEHQSRHHWLGWQLDVQPYYAAMDLLAVPSLVHESFGRVSIEAQACGTPVFANRTAGGLPETLSDGLTGRLLPPDASVWATALEDFAVLPASVHLEQRHAARRWVDEHFSSQVIIAEFLRLVAKFRATGSHSTKPSALP